MLFFYVDWVLLFLLLVSPIFYGKIEGGDFTLWRVDFVAGFCCVGRASVVDVVWGSLCCDIIVSRKWRVCLVQDSCLVG